LHSEKNTDYSAENIEMDFQRLFKRKDESPARPMPSENGRESLNEREVLVGEGDLLDGARPACLAWSSVGGTIRVKADKILGILEGRTRIKAAALQEIYPGLFEKAPNPGAEFNIPLQAVVTQLEDLFVGLSSVEAGLEDLETPFGKLAREDEARFKDQSVDQPEAGKVATPNLLMLPRPGSKPDRKEQAQSAGRETATATPSEPALEEERPLSEANIRSAGPHRDSTNHVDSVDPLLPSTEKLDSASRSQGPLMGDSAISPGAQRVQNDKIRRAGHECLQELYLTDAALDGSKVAELILKLPRVAGVVIMLSDGAALGGGLSGGLSEALLSLTPDLAKHLSHFSKGIEGGPLKFVTLSGHACQVSLTIGGEVLILTEHQGKNLPPGLRERLVATAQALSMIYCLQS
jgi:hypothetical protein